ncbi:MAG: HypC/HybG/HupF family hydrogenase formation chaperone [Candidatus Omnitrophica bacterium]|nr:HypC/HybG/HupF family hydrogenase formation chaperone [Candidatus Omnitrophota bacterium]
MCLAIPMKVIKIDGDECLVESGGLERRANLALLEGVKRGDYILLHAGFAIEKLDPAEARKTLRLINES